MSASRKRLTGPERRELILNATTELIARDGYDGASIRRVSDAAGVTPPVIYDHFASKEELQVSSLEAAADELIEAVTQGFPAASAEEFLRASVEAFFAFVEAHPHLWRMLFRDPPAHPEVAAAHDRVMRRAADALAGLFALTPKWRTSAKMRRADRLDAMAAATRSAINGLAGWWWDHRDVPREQVVALAMDLLWTGIERLRDEDGWRAKEQRSAGSAAS